MGNIQWPKSLEAKFRALPTDPQEATWECPTCGIIKPRCYEIDGVNHYGRIHTCPCQEREKERQEKERIRQQWVLTQASCVYSWLGSRWSDTALKEKIFANFDATYQSVAYEAAKLYAADPSGTLVLYGTFGTGKTHLLAAVCNECIMRYGKTSLFATAPELFGAILQKISHKEDYYEIVEKASKTPLFVIDDIDKSKWSEFKEEIYFAIIDRRTKRGLPTAISTNRLDELADFVGGAVCSRLQVGQIAIPMNGKDYRKEL